MRMLILNQLPSLLTLITRILLEKQDENMKSSQPLITWILNLNSYLGEGMGEALTRKDVIIILHFVHPSTENVRDS